MKKHYIGLMGAICVALLILLIWMEASDDHLAPEIHFMEDSLIWQQGEEETILMQGVTAMDEKDGDVTDSLIIEDIFLDEQQETATVIYVAKDQENNVGKASRQITYEAAEPETVQSTLEAGVAETIRTIEDRESETETEPETESGEEAGAEPESGEGEEAGTENEAPVITLTHERVEIAAGSAFNALAYVGEITDDKDDSSELSRRIAVTGNVNSEVPGTYQVSYTVQDSEGTRSEEVRLTVVVKDEGDSE